MATQRSALAVASTIRRGVAPGFRDGAYEAEARDGVLFVRYVGDSA